VFDFNLFFLFFFIWTHLPIQVKQIRHGTEVKIDLTVMESLLFGHNISRVYDLKGTCFFTMRHCPGPVIKKQIMVSWPLFFVELSAYMKILESNLG